MTAPVRRRARGVLGDHDLRDPAVIATHATSFCVTNFREIFRLINVHNLGGGVASDAI